MASDKRDLNKTVTAFLLNTCRLCPKSGKHKVEAAEQCAMKADERPRGDAEVHMIPLITGSGAEFYIEPMLPHVGDIDVMYHCSTQLAIPRGQSPPSQLPAEFHNWVHVFEIIDSHVPGYVYLKLRYLLLEYDHGGKYNAVDYDTDGYLLNRIYYADDSDIHGPALVKVHPSPLLSCDNVRCVRCLSWPSQAADWPTRHRIYGWPDSATVDHVANNGCDVVPVAHRQCRSDKWMGENQWRMSFSRAEIVLINSWMPVQQIVYHMLRVFMKNERLTDSVDTSEGAKCSNYYIKTLMLWHCEIQRRNWWTDDLDLVQICVQLLYKLTEWLTDAWCPHYFINNCNLIDNSFNVTNIVGQLMSVDELRLSTWFLDNYIEKCSQLCPHYITRLFDDVNTGMKLQKAVSEVVAWRLNNTLSEMWTSFEYAEFLFAVNAYERVTSRSCVYWINELKKLDSRLSDCFTGTIFLLVASKSSRLGFSDELMYILMTTLGHFIELRRYFINSTGEMSLSQAVKLLKVVANNSGSTVQLIEIELSKAYLCRALRCTDSDSDSVYCLANVYLAVLYYTTGQYQTAADHCSLVMRSQDHSQCSSHVVQGELLPKFDDDIDVTLGLAVFYQHVRTAAMNQQETQTATVTVCTIELFAYYLNMKCRQFTQTSPFSNKLKLYEICVSDTPQLYIGDVLLCMSVCRLFKQNFHAKRVTQRSEYSTVNSTEYNSSDLVELLQQSAVEHLTAYRQLKAREFGSVATIVTTDFEAVYAYKRGDYQRCLQLSTQNVHMLMNADGMTCVLTFPQFIQLLDDDIVSVIALTLIVRPRYTVKLNRSENYRITQLTLSLYLMTQCQLKLRHSVTSLADTLNCIKVAQRRFPVDRTLDQLTLKLTVRILIRHLQQLCSQWLKYARYTLRQTTTGAS